jgi:hypothetical protein
MAGKGPAPKPSGTRVRRNAAPQDTVIEVEAGTQPDLPEKMPMPVVVDGEVVGFGQAWPSQTVAWWRMWAEHPIAETFTDSDWSFLLDTALLHGAYWNGDLKLGPELRQRVAKFGATPEDRARLRISFAVATKSEREAAKGTPPAPPKKGPKKKDPRAYLTVVQDGA